MGTVDGPGICVSVMYVAAIAVQSRIMHLGHCRQSQMRLKFAIRLQLSVQMMCVRSGTLAPSRPLGQPQGQSGSD